MQSSIFYLDLHFKVFYNIVMLLMYIVLLVNKIIMNLGQNVCLLQKLSDLDLHCLQRQGISGFSRTRVKISMIHQSIHKDRLEQIMKA